MEKEDLQVKFFMYLVAVILFIILAEIYLVFGNTYIHCITVIIGIYYLITKKDIIKIGLLKNNKKQFLFYHTNFLFLLFISLPLLMNGFLNNVLKDVYPTYILEKDIDHSLNFTTSSQLTIFKSYSDLEEIVGDIDLELAEIIVSDPEQFISNIMDVSNELSRTDLDNIINILNRTLDFYSSILVCSIFISFIIVFSMMYFINIDIRKWIYLSAIFIYAFSMINTFSNGLISLKISSFSSTSGLEMYSASLMINHVFKILESGLIVLIAIDTYMNLNDNKGNTVTKSSEVKKKKSKKNRNKKQVHKKGKHKNKK